MRIEATTRAENKFNKSKFFVKIAPLTSVLRNVEDPMKQYKSVLKSL